MLNINIDKSEKFAKALLKDFANPQIRKKIEDAKKDAWKNPEAFWSKILTNQMHIGSNKRVLEKRMETEGFKLASNFKEFVVLDKKQRKELLDKFVPGGRNCKKETKVQRLLKALDTIASNDINSLFGSNLSKEQILCNLMSVEGIGSKQARNIPMDLYHPAFRNGSIPIDENWKKIAKYLGFNWSKSEIHEDEIIEWRNKYVGRNTIKEDWEFDRLVYWALNENSSKVRKVIVSLNQTGYLPKS